MTSYSFTLTFDDSEIGVVADALDQYKKFCAQRLAQGDLVPYTRHQELAEKIRSRLYDRPTQLSRNNFS